MSNEAKIQKTSGGVVHAGQRMEDYFTPNCGSGVVYAMGTLRSIAGFRELPETTEVTCKKCLKLLAKVETEAVQANAVSKRKAQAKAALTAEATPKSESEGSGIDWTDPNEKMYAFGSKPPKIETPRKTRTFTFEYNASEGVMIAAVLREKALVERKVAQGYRTNAAIEGTTLVEFYTEQARLADNRAKLYEDAAEKMHEPVREAISTAVMNALPDEPEPALHRQMKDAIDLRW